MNVNDVYDKFGNIVPITVDHYARKLQTVYLEIKEGGFRQRANLVEETDDNDEEANFVGKGNSKFSTPNKSKFSPFTSSKNTSNLAKDFSKSKFGTKFSDKPREKPICFAFRDHGKCKFGDKCSFSHVQVPTAFKVATPEELEQQEVANKIQHLAYKMAKYKKRAILTNQQKMEFHKKSVSTGKGISKGPHKAHLADEFVEDSANNDSANEEMANVAAEEITDPFDLTSPDTSDQDA
jgi:hypothetical protein